MAGLDPEPLLDWSKPYKLEHIEWAIERRGRRHLIDIFPFGEEPADTNKLKRVCLVEAPKDHWGVWLVQEKNTSLALSAPPSLSDEKGTIFFSCIINKFFFFCIFNKKNFFLVSSTIFFSCTPNKKIHQKMKTLLLVPNPRSLAVPHHTSSKSPTVPISKLTVSPRVC